MRRIEKNHLHMSLVRLVFNSVKMLLGAFVRLLCLFNTEIKLQKRKKNKTETN